eukprot:6151028-Alexandrium_andersonii.AAC.1
MRRVSPWSSARSARRRSGSSRYSGVSARGNRGTQSATPFQIQTAHCCEVLGPALVEALMLVHGPKVPRLGPKHCAGPW